MLGGRGRVIGRALAGCVLTSFRPFELGVPDGRGVLLPDIISAGLSDSGIRDVEREADGQEDAKADGQAVTGDEAEKEIHGLAS